MITKFNEYINEKSINQKRRDVNFAKGFFINGQKKYKGIGSFGIISADNSNSTKSSSSYNKKNRKDLNKILKDMNYIYVPIDGYYQGNIEKSYLIFNISFSMLENLAHKYRQTSFFYCYREENEIISEYWETKNTELEHSYSYNEYEMKDKSSIYNIITDEEVEAYSIIGRNFKFNIQLSIFDILNEQIINRVTNISDKVNKDIETILYESTNLIFNFKGCHYKKMIYENIKL